MDPAQPMVRAATTRNRDGVARGQVHLEPATAADLPWGAATFDGALAVNSIQMWEPRDHPSVDAWWASIAQMLGPPDSTPPSAGRVEPKTAPRSA